MCFPYIDGWYTTNQSMFFSDFGGLQDAKILGSVIPIFFGHPKGKCRSKKGGGCPTAVESSYSAMGVVSFKYQIIGGVINPNKL